MSIYTDVQLHQFPELQDVIITLLSWIIQTNLKDFVRGKTVFHV